MQGYEKQDDRRRSLQREVWRESRYSLWLCPHTTSLYVLSRDTEQPYKVWIWQLGMEKKSLHL